MKTNEYAFIREIRNINFLLNKLIIETNSKNENLFYTICDIGVEKEIRKISKQLDKIQIKLIKYFQEEI